MGTDKSTKEVFSELLKNEAVTSKKEGKLPLDVIEHDTQWVAKMQGYRKTGTYDELKTFRESEDCRDFDICARQPEHLRDFYDAYFDYDRKYGFITIQDFYFKYYNPTKDAGLLNEEEQEQFYI